MKSIIFYLCFLFVLVFPATLQTSCSKTPFWKLNICQIDCQKCGANGICENCPEGFNLTKTKCVEDNDTIYRYKYFTDTEQTSKSISQYNFKISNQYFKVSNIVTICKAGSYKFDMMGLFNQQDRMTFNLNFDTPVTSLIFKFNFFTIYQNTKIQLVMNGDQVYQNKLTGSGINNTYEPYDDKQEKNYLSIPSLTESSTSVLIRKMNTGQIAFDSDQFKNNVFLQIEVSLSNDPKNTNKFWGFSDFSVVAKRCEVCLPERLKILSSNVGIAIGVNAGALLFLILILYGCVKFEQRKRRRALQDDEDVVNLVKEEDKYEDKDQQKDEKLKIRETVQKPIETGSGNKKNKNT